MSRYIDVEQFTDDYANDRGNMLLKAYYKLFDSIKNTPAVDVAPAARGKWLLEREPNGNPYCFHCSVCDGDFHHIGIKVAYNYCPNCGARMDGDGK